MSLPIRLRPDVVDDLTEAARWYAQRRELLGDEFLDAAYKAFEVIGSRPASFPIVHKDVRRALMKRFPYAIYFREERDAVVVFVVIHTARSPKRWRRRLR